MSNYNYTPSFTGMRKNARATGYRLPTAVEEFIDNSISKLATKIDLVLLAEFDNKDRLGGFAVMDDALGMTEKKLHTAFAMAQNVSDRDAHDIGCYHMGMKTAAMSMCNAFTILSRTKDGKIAGIHANFLRMAENDTFNPTDHSDDVSEEWANKYIPSLIYNRFVKNPSGTLVYCDHLLPIARQSYTSAREELTKALGICYSTQKLHAAADPFRITIDWDGGSETIRPTDLFYDSDETKLDYPSYNTTLRVYRDSSHNIRIFEENTQSRLLNRSQQSTHGTQEDPKYYEYVDKRTKKRSTTATLVSKDSLPPQSDCIGSISARFVQASQSAFDSEVSYFLDNDPLRSDRKGFYVTRNSVRTIAAAFDFGSKVHDRTKMNKERQRIRIDCPASLDELVGCKFNKQMQDQMLPCELLVHALMNIAQSVFRDWDTKSNSLPPTPDTLSVISDDTYQLDTDTPTTNAANEVVVVERIDTSVIQRKEYIQSILSDIASKEFLCQTDKDTITSCLNRLLTNGE